jgi:hypothetical protein
VREGFGADVEREHLQHTDRERNSVARKCPYDEGRELRDVVGEVVGEEASNVGVRGAPLLDGGDDRCEIVVEQDEVRGLARDIRS